MLVADGDGQGWFEKSTYDFAKGNAVVLKATMRKNKNCDLLPALKCGASGEVY